MLHTEDPHLAYYPGQHHQFVMFIGLNPSTADETKDDPTIRRCIGFAKRWGFGALCMTNLFAFRATDPEVMKRTYDCIGFENHKHLMNVASNAGLVIAAWGVHGTHKSHDKFMRDEFNKAGIKLHHLGLTNDGHPRHPLYLKKDVQPSLYEI